MGDEREREGKGKREEERERQRERERGRPLGDGCVSVDEVLTCGERMKMKTRRGKDGDKCHPGWWKEGLTQ